MFQTVLRSRTSAPALFVAYVLAIGACGGRTELGLSASQSEGGGGNAGALGGTAASYSSGGSIVSAGSGGAAVARGGNSAGGGISSGGVAPSAGVGGGGGIGGTTTGCAPRRSLCGSECVDLTINAFHCGACENACAAGSTCQYAQCVSACATPLLSCSNRCVDVQSDVANCGACGHVCPMIAGADSLCENGRCTLACHGATSNCDGDVSNGCETLLDHCHKRVFVSSAVYTGNLGGLAGADSKCQALADAAMLGGSYKAWMSDEAIPARDRLTHSADSYVLPSGQEIAANWSALVSFITHPIDETEGRELPAATPGIGGPCSESPAVMTGTFGDGTIDQASTCNNWTDDGSSSLVGIGNTDYASLWTAHCAADWCDIPMHIYCFEQ